MRPRVATLALFAGLLVFAGVRHANADSIGIAPTGDTVVPLIGSQLRLEMSSVAVGATQVTVGRTVQPCSSPVPPCDAAPEMAAGRRNAAALQSVLSALYAMAPVLRLDTLVTAAGSASAPKAPGYIDLFTSTLMPSDDPLMFPPGPPSAAWDQAQTVLQGIAPTRVLAYLTNAGAIDARLYKTMRLRGTLFSPEGEVLARGSTETDISARLPADTPPEDERPQRRWFWQNW